MGISLVDPHPRPPIPWRYVVALVAIALLIIANANAVIVITDGIANPGRYANLTDLELAKELFIPWT